jgi:[acyl-carrier-protein] S-malonyltransferase
LVPAVSLALLFPGQGAQEAGMGIGLLDAGAPGHELARRGGELVGLDLVRLACEADADEIRATEVAQPLLLLHSVALFKLLPEATRSEVSAVAGHSLGEYTALVAAGSLAFDDAIRLVRERGLAMAEAAAGAQGQGKRQGMSAVLGADEAQVVAALAPTEGEVAVVANINAPGQVVISGHLAALAAAGERLKAAGARRVMPLAVGGAFHSPLMADAAARLGRAIEAAPIGPGRPQAFNVDGRIRTEPADIAAALQAQLTSPVRWTTCMETLVASGVDRFLELGPGNTLTAMGKRINPEVRWSAVSSPAGLVAVGG